MTRFFPMVLNGEPQSSGLLHGTLLESLHRPLKHLTIKWETREAIFGYHLLSTWVEVKNVLLKEPFFTKISLRILNLLYYLPSKFIRHFFFSPQRRKMFLSLLVKSPSKQFLTYCVKNCAKCLEDAKTEILLCKLNGTKIQWQRWGTLIITILIHFTNTQTIRGMRLKEIYWKQSFGSCEH